MDNDTEPKFLSIYYNIIKMSLLLAATFLFLCTVVSAFVAMLAMIGIMHPFSIFFYSMVICVLSILLFIWCLVLLKKFLRIAR